MRPSTRFIAVLALCAGLGPVPSFGQAGKKKAAEPLAAGRALERWESMTPEQRERALSRLSPERRAQIEERLRRLEQLPPEERERLKQRYQDFAALPRDRQDALRLEIQALRNMRPVMRRRRVMSPEFQRHYSPEEKRILREALGME
jgi:hypothetical protein